MFSCASKNAGRYRRFLKQLKEEPWNSKCSTACYDCGAELRAEELPSLGLFPADILCAGCMTIMCLDHTGMSLACGCDRRFCEDCTKDWERGRAQHLQVSCCDLCALDPYMCSSQGNTCALCDEFICAVHMLYGDGNIVDDEYYCEACMKNK